MLNPQLVATACVYLAAKVEERHNVKLSQIVVRYLVLEGRLPQEVDPAAYNKHPVRACVLAFVFVFVFVYVFVFVPPP